MRRQPEIRRGRAHLLQLLHVLGLDVDNVKALVVDAQVPEVDAQIIAADVGLPIAVDGNAVDVVGVGVGIRPPRYCSDHSIMMCEAGQLQIGGIPEC